MKTSFVVICAFLLLGCASSRQSKSLTAEQARVIATQLANNKAAAVYHCQPFQDGQPAHFVADHWIWTDQHGYGLGDIRAKVELAADGTTRNVDLQLLDNRSIVP